MSGADWIRVVIVVAFTLTAAIIDFRTRRIPNWLTVPAFFAGVAFFTLGGGSNFGVAGGLEGLFYSLRGFLLGFGILFVLMAIGKGGAGDVKLMGAVGAWLGWKFTLLAYVLSVCFALLASVLVLFNLVGKRGMSGLRPQPLSTSADDKQRAKPARKGLVITYALPVALGTWLVPAWQVVGQKH